MKEYSLHKVFSLFCGICLVLPLVFTSFTMFPWLFGKTIFFQITVELFSILFFLFLLQQRKVKLRRLQLLDYAVLAFLLILTVTAITGVNFSHSFWPTQARALGVFTWLHFGILYFFLTQLSEKESWWNRLFVISSVVALLIGLSAVFQKFLPEAWNGDAGGIRFSGILGNPGFFASYLLLHVGLSLFLFFSTKKKKLQVLSALSVVFFTACVLLSGIRGAALGLGAGIVVAGGATLLLRRQRQQSVGSTLTLLVIFIFLGIGLFLFSKSSYGHVLPDSVQRLSHYSFSESGSDPRVMAWKIAGQGFVEKPLLGWGWGNYDIVFNTHYNPAFLLHSFRETVWDKPHNALLEFLVGSGVFGLMPLGIVGIALWYAWGWARRGQEKQAVTLIFLLVSYAVQNFFLFDTTNVLIPLTFILAFLSFVHANEKNVKKVTKEFSRVHLVWMVAVIGVLFFSIYKWNIRSLQASAALNTAVQFVDIFSFNKASATAINFDVPLRDESLIFLAEHITKLDKIKAVSKENIQFGEESILRIATSLEEVSSLHSDNVLYPLWAAQLHIILGQYKDPLYYEKAITLLQKALLISPTRQETYFLLGRTYLLQKNFPLALQVEEKAVALDAEIPLSHWFFGLAKIASGQTKTGLESLGKAMSLGYGVSVGERQYLIKLYEQEKLYPQLIHHYKILHDEEPTNPEWALLLATAYAKNGQKKEALETYDEAMLLYPPLAENRKAFIEQFHL